MFITRQGPLGPPLSKAIWVQDENKQENAGDTVGNYLKENMSGGIYTSKRSLQVSPWQF